MQPLFVNQTTLPTYNSEKKPSELNGKESASKQLQLFNAPQDAPATKACLVLMHRIEHFVLPKQSFKLRSHKNVSSKAIFKVIFKYNL